MTRDYERLHIPDKRFKSGMLLMLASSDSAADARYSGPWLILEDPDWHGIYKKYYAQSYNIRCSRVEVVVFEIDRNQREGRVDLWRWY